MNDLVRVGVAPPALVEAARAELATEPALAPLFDASRRRHILNLDDLTQCSALRELAHWASDNHGPGRLDRVCLHSLQARAYLKAHKDGGFGSDRRLTVALEPESGAHFKAGGSEADHRRVGVEALMMPGEVWAWRYRAHHSVRNHSTERLVVMILSVSRIIIEESSSQVWMNGENEDGKAVRVNLGHSALAAEMMMEWLSSWPQAKSGELRCGPGFEEIAPHLSRTSAPPIRSISFTGLGGTEGGERTCWTLAASGSRAAQTPGTSDGGAAPCLIRARLVQPAERHLIPPFSGEFLGAGATRRVFAYEPDPGLVVKISNPPGGWHGLNANIAEAAFWRVASEPIRRWPAPVEWVSANGDILLQRRTSPIAQEDIPEVIVGSLTLCNEPQNWSLLDGRPVVHDYAPFLIRFAAALQNASECIAPGASE